MWVFMLQTIAHRQFFNTHNLHWDTHQQTWKTKWLTYRCCYVIQSCKKQPNIQKKNDLPITSTSILLPPLPWIWNEAVLLTDTRLRPSPLTVTLLESTMSRLNGEPGGGERKRRNCSNVSLCTINAARCTTLSSSISTCKTKRQLRAIEYLWFQFISWT